MKVCLACKEEFESLDWACPACGHRPSDGGGYAKFAPAMAAENDGFDARYFKDLHELEAANFWFRARNRLIVSILQRHFANARNFCEIGCGTGYVLGGLRAARPDLHFAGSEIFTAGLEFARQRLPDVDFFQADARALPFKAEFDVIGAFDVLEHIDEDERVLSQFHRALRPGGGIIITVPQHRWLWSAIDDYSCHKRRYHRGELLDKIHRTGFRVNRITSFVSSLLPLMFVPSWTKPQRVEDLDPLAELRVNRLLGTIFESALGLERLLIMAGLSLPLGGSLVAVATREKHT